MAGAPRFPWYKHDAQAFLIGVQGMGPDLIGAYIVILDLIYARGGELRRDDRHLAGVLGCSTRLAKSLTDRLIELGKVAEEGDHLVNFRAETELKQQRTSHELRANAQRMRREKERQSREINDLPTQVCLVEAPKEEKRREEIEERSTNVLPKKKGQTRGTRLPEDWKPDQEWSKATGLPRDVLIEEFQKFRDYWHGKSGKDATKVDWDATWRNWIRNSKAYQARNASKAGKPKTIGDSFVDLARDMGILPDEQRDCEPTGLFGASEPARDGAVLDLAVEPAEPGGQQHDDFTRRLLRSVGGR